MNQSQKLTLKDLPWPISTVLNNSGEDNPEEIHSDVLDLKIPKTWTTGKRLTEPESNEVLNEKTLARLPFSRSNYISDPKFIKDSNSSSELSLDRQILTPTKCDVCPVQSSSIQLENSGKLAPGEDLLLTARQVVDFAILEGQVWLNTVEALQSKCLKKSTPSSAQLLTFNEALVLDECDDGGDFQQTDLSSNGVTSTNDFPENDTTIQISEYQEDSDESNKVRNKETQTASIINNNTKEAHVQTDLIQFGRRSISAMDLTYFKKGIFNDLLSQETNDVKNTSEPEKGQMEAPRINHSTVSDMDYPAIQACAEAIQKNNVASTSAYIAESVHQPEVGPSLSPPLNKTDAICPERTVNQELHESDRDQGQEYRRRNHLEPSAHSNLELATQAPLLSIPVQKLIVSYSSMPNIVFPGKKANQHDHGSGLNGSESESNASVGSAQSGASSGGSSGYVADDERSLTNSMEEDSEAELGQHASSHSNI